MPPANEVAGAVEAVGGSRSERVGDKSRCGQFGPPEVATSETVTADVQLPRHPERHQLASLVEDVELRIGDRLTQVHGSGVDRRHGRPDGGLRRPIHVPNRDAGREQVQGQRVRQCLSPDVRAKARAPCPAAVQQHPPRRGRRLHDRGLAAVEQLCQPARVRGDLARSDDQLGSVNQRQEQLEHRNVERQGGDGDQRVVRFDPGAHLHGLEEVAERAVRDLHAFGPPRRARRVDHVRQILGLLGSFGGVTRLRLEVVAYLVKTDDDDVGALIE